MLKEKISKQVVRCEDGSLTAISVHSVKKEVKQKLEQQRLKELEEVKTFRASEGIDKPADSK